MAYSYLGAYLLRKPIGKRWRELNVSEMIVSDLYDQYTRIVLKLSLNEEVIYADLDQLRSDYRTYNNTVSVLLQSIGDRALDGLEKLPWGKQTSVVYNDAVRGGYSYKFCKIGYNYPINYPTEEFFDLELYRTTNPVDMGLIHSHCLVSVNGFYHQTSTNGERTFIIDGGRSIRKENVGHVGITSFYAVGALTQTAIKEEDIFPSAEGRPLRETIGFTVEGVSDDQPFFLVLGGYLVFPEDEVFWKAGENNYRLNLNKLPYLERILESQNFISLESLELTESELNETNINLDEVWSDDVLKRYLTLSQTFLVTVDCESLYWEQITLRQALMPGIFTAYQEPKLPLMVGHGRTAEYWKVFEDTYWAVTVMDVWFRRYIFDRNMQNELVNVTSQLAMDRPFFYSQGILLDIGSYTSTAI